MVKRWAIIINGTVDNVCLWDGNRDTWQPPEGAELVELADEQVAAPGYRYDGKTFAPPAAPAEA